MTTLLSVSIALVFNAIDIVTGLVKALKDKNLKSAKLRDGLFKKCGFLICYFVAWILDMYGATIGFDIPVAILPFIVFYVCSTELVSILENVCKINPDIIPEKLFEMFNLK